jgi:hypothetical protein
LKKRSSYFVNQVWFNFCSKVNLKTPNRITLLATEGKGVEKKTTMTTMTTPISKQHHTDDPLSEGETDPQDLKSADKGKLLFLSIRQLTKKLT